MRNFFTFFKKNSQKREPKTEPEPAARKQKRIIRIPEGPHHHRLLIRDDITERGKTRYIDLGLTKNPRKR